MNRIWYWGTYAKAIEQYGGVSIGWEPCNQIRHHFPTIEMAAAAYNLNLTKAICYPSTNTTIGD